MTEVPKVLERRPKRRKRVLLGGMIASSDGARRFDCTIRDLTEDGARIEVHSSCLLEGQFYFLNIRDRTAHLVRVAWRSHKEIGLIFIERIALAGALSPHHLFLKELWLARATR